MSIRLKDCKRYYIGENWQREAVENLGRELIQRGFHSMTTPASWLNFTDDHLDRIQAVVGQASLDRFAAIWRNQKVVTPSVDWYDMNSKVSNYFNVREVTNNDTRRIPTSITIQNNILELAKELDKVREAWNSPIIVTSWYRPSAINAQIGGSRFSQHIKGKAADIRPSQGNLYSFQKWLDERWYGAFGYGAKRGFCHCDNRNNKGYMTGGSKGVRWNY